MVTGGEMTAVALGTFLRTYAASLPGQDRTPRTKEALRPVREDTGVGLQQNGTAMILPGFLGVEPDPKWDRRSAPSAQLRACFTLICRLDLHEVTLRPPAERAVTW